MGVIDHENPLSRHLQQAGQDRAGQSLSDDQVVNFAHAVVNDYRRFFPCYLRKDTAVKGKYRPGFGMRLGSD